MTLFDRCDSLTLFFARSRFPEKACTLATSKAFLTPTGWRGFGYRNSQALAFVLPYAPRWIEGIP